MMLAATRDDTDMRARRCIVSGEVLPEGELIRFVADPENHIVPDVAAKLPGRGLWVRAERETIAKAVSKKLFARAARARVEATDDLARRTEELLVAHMLNTLGLARRAGQLLLGFEKIERALRSANPPAVIVEAVEAASDGRRKLHAAALAGGARPFVLGSLTGGELRLALGLPNVVHAALEAGRLAERLVFDAGRLKGFRPLKSLDWNGLSGRKGTSTGA